MLEIYNLTKKFGEKTAVDDLSITVQDGQICAFIGHNGAGKTTTLKCIAGILDFDKGEIKVDKIDIKDHPMEAKKILTYIPDNPDLYDHLKGIDYLNFIASIFDMSKEERKAKIEQNAKRLDIYNDLNTVISSYSHGMKQKLAIISALIHEPKLMIMDEPFVGLDPRSAHTLKQLMRELCERGGAIFFSTHVLEVAEKLCDKVAIIKNGRLIRSGTMDEVKGDESLESVFLELEGENA